jgi:hypothetical protein
VIRATSKVKNDPEKDEGNDGQDLDGADEIRPSFVRVSHRRNWFSESRVHARKHEFGFPICTYHSLMSTRGAIPSEVKWIRTGTKHVDRDNHDHAHRDPNRGAYCVVPISDNDCSGTTVSQR